MYLCRIWDRPEKISKSKPCLYEIHKIKKIRNVCLECSYYNNILFPPKPKKKYKRRDQKKRDLKTYLSNFMEITEYWEGELISEEQFEEMEKIIKAPLIQGCRQALSWAGGEFPWLVKEYVFSSKHKKTGVQRKNVPLDFIVGQIIEVWYVATGGYPKFKKSGDGFTIEGVIDLIKYFLVNCLKAHSETIPTETIPIQCLWSDDSIIYSIKKHLRITNR